MKKAFLNKLLISSVFAALALGACKKKEGCMDPTATNYDSEAKKECDNCCTYASDTTDTDTTGKIITITDDGSGTGTTTWTAENTYVLDGFVFVNSGQTLTIEPGTVVKGKAGEGANASALIVAQGGKIEAVGTADSPIIFTFESDPLDGTVPVSTRGQWGGIIVLGYATLNSSPSTTQIEGIPTNETRGIYGGSNDNDNSGTIKYISIRHGGTDIGAGNEINGLTLGGVGSGTTIDYVEVIANKDDGIEFFGGTARVKHAVVAFCGDDSYDYDEGFRGFGQYWLTIQADDEGDRGGEHDGGTSPEDGTPYATPTIVNATYIGRGITAGKRALTFRDNAGGTYMNSIFFNWGKGIDVENLDGGEDSYARFSAGDLKLEGNVFWEVGVSGSSATGGDLFKITMGSWSDVTDSTNQLDLSTTALVESFASNNNLVQDVGLSYSFTTGGLDITPNSISPSGSATDSWFESTTYVGAIDPSGTPWVKGWTLLDGYQPNGSNSPSYIQ